ncbi:hypothetical protein CTA2_10202 [Colletotrichum tanaceti]|uniref:Uncharacterized protein n=1 Tax=Colletotrichum tanaceti TaxID=1306861 RepID=A0A4U6XFE1_9PEZI|nr:hypothetical protein CTA2_10202 [Colletotrichum tanaceti]TKW54163.1 hypothetical protein CTA1_6679 [Colletotrichum tanaceti]
MMAVLKDRNLTTAAKLSDASDKRFAYPSEKRRTKATTAVMIQSEANLDAFWAVIDRLLGGTNEGVLRDTATARFLSNKGDLQRTPEWVDDPTPAIAEGQGRRGDGHGGAPGRSEEAFESPFVTLPFQDDGRPPVIPKRTSNLPSAKTKTRGQPSSQEPPPPPPPETAAASPAAESAQRSTPTRPLVRVDARSLKVFRTLFFDPAVSSHPGEIAWKDFLHALTSTSMFAAEKLYGSVWQFQRVDGHDQSRLQFHEPHPRSKIPYAAARRHGRRLNRHYGWTRDMFLLRES